MKNARWAKAFCWGLVTGVATFTGFCLLSPTIYTEQFITESIAEMRRFKDPMQVPEAYTRRFADGSSIAVFMEHACCSGRGYNATVIYDSEGQIFVNTDRSFCGYEGLSYEMSSVPAESLPDFYAHLHELLLTERR